MLDHFCERQINDLVVVYLLSQILTSVKILRLYKKKH